MKAFSIRFSVLASAIAAATTGHAADAIRIVRKTSVSAHEKKLRGLDFSPDGSLLASAGDDKTVRIWRVADGSLKPAFDPVGGHTRVKFSPDGELLYVGRGTKLTSFDVFDLAAKKFVLTVDAGHNVESIALAPDGLRIVTAAFRNRDIHVWDTKTGRKIESLTSPTRRTPGAAGTNNRALGFVAYSPDGKYFAGCVAPSNSLAIPTIWDAKTLAARSQFVAHEHRCYSLAFSPDSKSLAIGARSGSLKLWDVATVIKAWDDRTGTKPDSKKITDLIVKLDDDDFDVRESAEKDLSNIGAAAAKQARAVLESTKSIEVRTRLRRILNAIGGPATKPLEGLKPRHVLATDQTGGVRSLAFSPDGRLLAAGSWFVGKRTGQLRVFDLQNPRQPILSIDTVGIEAVAFSPDGKTLAAGMQDGEIVLWGVE